MKVLQILPELTAGGVERGTLEIGSFLVQQGHEAVAVSNGGRMVPQLTAAGIRHITMPVHRKSLGSLFQVRPLRRLLETERPDILHIRSRVPGWIAWLAWRKMNPATRPHFVSTVHGFNSVNAYSRIMTRGERVIAVSACIRDYIRRHYPKVPEGIIRVIPRGIEPAQYPRSFQPDAVWLERWREQYPQLAGRHVLVLPGRITRLKGHEPFLQLIAALVADGENVHGLIVGDAHEKKQGYLTEVQQLTNSLGLTDRVTFTGHRSDLREIFAVSDIVCSLSTQPESFGRTTLEALAIGRKVLAYDHGGVAEQLRALFPKGLVPLGDAAALKATARRLLSGDYQPKPVGPPYTLEAMCRATLDTYLELRRNS